MNQVIGVFDSGVGGLSVANAIQVAFPDNKVIYREDRKNIPYGTKSAEQLYKLVLPILKDLADQCDIVVIACNTVTTTLIDQLRLEIETPLVGIEPMIKPAAQLSQTKTITVCATPTTLTSQRYAYLKAMYAQSITVIEPDCSDWAELIEQNTINKKKLYEDIAPSLNKGSDVIVLGCTHYHWIENQIRELVNGTAIVIQPEQAIISRLQALITKH